MERIGETDGKGRGNYKKLPSKIVADYMSTNRLTTSQPVCRLLVNRPADYLSASGTTPDDPSEKDKNHEPAIVVSAYDLS
jgi:hypothetical protein